MPKYYSNNAPIPRTSTVSVVRYHPPYVASSYSNLTHKERLARQQTKMLTAVSGGTFGGGIADSVLSSQGNFFSPQLSTDFLELPQSRRERLEIYRHFYNTDELVGQAIDLHTEIPLSKVRLAPPKPRTCPEGFKDPHDYGRYILSRFERMCENIKLFEKLITIVHHYWLEGTSAVFAEDGQVEVPQEVGHSKSSKVTSVLEDSGEAVERSEDVWVANSDQEDQELAYYQKHYGGWARLIILPLDKVKITTASLTDRVRVELIPSDRDRALIEQAKSGDPVATDMARDIPLEVREHIEQGRFIPLGTDPDEGSFVHLLSGRKSADSQLGQSILDRCHLPGTPVLVRREGTVQQVAIEDLDPDTDEVLSHQGLWREFEHGARKIDEEVAAIRVAKLGQPILCTRSHKYPVLREDSVVSVEAGDIQPGDYLQVAQIPLTDTLRSFDLVDFLDGLEEQYEARKSGNTADLKLTAEALGSNLVKVFYVRGQTDPRKIKRHTDICAILRWASQLKVPVVLRSSEVCERFGLHPVTLKEIRAQLARYDYYPEVLRGKTLRFKPFQGIIPEAIVKNEKVFPRWIKLDTDLGYFLGFWLGDGHIARQSGLDYGVLGFTYGPKEAASVASVAKVRAILDRFRVAFSDSENGTARSLFGYQDGLVRWIAYNFGHTSEDKHLPGWIYDAPRTFLKALLRGFVDSDGDVVGKQDGSVSVRFNGSNEILMDQIFLLCTSLGIPVSKSKPTRPRMVKQADGRMSLARPMYAVHFTHGPSVRSFFESGFLAKRKEPQIWKDGHSGSRHKVHTEKLFYRVQGVDSATHQGLVYSLNVHEDHTFFAGNCCNFNCLRTLFYRDKLRQAQTSIASRAMTPKRIVWAEGLSNTDVDELREQVDLSLVDPDYSIVANYEIRWEEMGSKDRLLDLSVEYEQTERRLLSGLGVTESLMSGESLYSGDRLKLEVINTRYLHLREIIQNYVHGSLFKPVARRMGFVEKDEWGQEVVLYPRLSFTRLPLRDSQDTFDALMNLYQKGSIPVELVLEVLGLDAEDTRVKLENDALTVNDAIFNEVLRSMYSEVGRMLAEKTDVVTKIAKYLKLGKSQSEGEESQGRF